MGVKRELRDAETTWLPRRHQVMLWSTQQGAAFITGESGFEREDNDILKRHVGKYEFLERLVSNAWEQRNVGGKQQ